jgi:heptosyltransferase-3
MKEKRLLIIHQGSLGDFVLTFPAIILLKKKLYCIDAICQSRLGKLACGLNVIDRWFPLEAASFASLYSDDIDSTVKEIIDSYHHVVLFSFSTDLEKAIKKISSGNVYLIPPRPVPSQKTHVSSHILSHLAGSGLLGEGDDAQKGIEPPIQHPDEGKRPFISSKILIHPGSGSRKKIWPVSNFIKIDVSLRSNGLTPEFILGPAEHFLLEILKQDDNQKRVVHIIDELTDLVLLFNTAGGFIGNDSGMSHLAAFMDLPTVAVFGPSDPERWKPVGRAVKVVRPALECSPCFETEIKDCEQMECFDKTSPETVLNAFYRLIGR